MLRNEKKAPARSAVLTALLGFSLISQPLTAQDIDLANLGSAGFRIDGVEANDGVGRSVSGAGDVNGDGLADIIVGGPGVDGRGQTVFDVVPDVGAAYVVFGKPDTQPVSLSNLGAGGLRLVGASARDAAGTSVSAAGDVNGDGLADLIVGANVADPGGRNAAGSSYVVFGRPSGGFINLGNLGAGGFRIDGAAVDDLSGDSVSGAGDVNGDGLADLIVGAPLVDLPEGSPGNDAGSSYVVFGKSDTGTVDLGNLGSGGFQIVADQPGGFLGISVAGAGDVNGDGLADLIVGAPLAQLASASALGVAYVVFGKNDSNPVEVGELGDGGFLISFHQSLPSLGAQVSSAGDVNRDGLADLFVGGIEGLPAYVVFGKQSSTPVVLSVLQTGGFRIEGSDTGNNNDLAGAGDVNGDGLSDLIVGIGGADSINGARAGVSYVVFGKADSSPFDLHAEGSGMIGTGGFRIDGAGPGDLAGQSVAGAGDVNGDGLDDLIVGTPLADPDSNLSAGSSYVIFSQSTPSPTAVYKARIRNGDPPQVAIGGNGDGSGDGNPSSRAWIDFANGSDPTGEASTVEATLNRTSGSLPNAAAAVSWVLTTDRVNWSGAELQFRFLDSELESGIDRTRLQLVQSVDGNAPFTTLSESVVNPLDNTISAVVDELGVFFLQVPDEIFGNGFE